MADGVDQVCPRPGACDWQPVEVVLEQTAADTISECGTCGATGYQAGQGRTRRPALPEILYTTGELD